MWMVFARAPPPDAPYWPGRRWLAAVDAVAWRGAAWGALSCFVDRGGVMLAFAMALLAVSVARRLFTALFNNHRYHFMTWWWVRAVLWLLVVATMLKAGLSP